MTNLVLPLDLSLVVYRPDKQVIIELKTNQG